MPIHKNDYPPEWYARKLSFDTSTNANGKRRSSKGVSPNTSRSNSINASSSLTSSASSSQNPALPSQSSILDSQHIKEGQISQEPGSIDLTDSGASLQRERSIKSALKRNPSLPKRVSWCEKDFPVEKLQSLVLDSEKGTDHHGRVLNKLETVPSLQNSFSGSYSS